MFKLNLGDTPHSLTIKDLRDLGSRTDGYSGADISNKHCREGCSHAACQKGADSDSL